jgi:alanine racemase
MAVLKANAYGHGLIEAARALSTAEGFAVLSLSEAIELREYGFDQHLLLLEGFFSAYEVNVCSQMNIGAVIHNAQQIDFINQIKPKNPINIHLKINTGMNRLGFVPSEIKTLINACESNPYVGNIILMTHFANADEAIGVKDQLALFNTFTDHSYDRSVANSAAIIRYPETHMEWVRPGIMLYGASPFEDQSIRDIGLQPVMCLHSKIIAIQNLDQGQSVGYGSTFVATNKMRVGIVACGYADGYPRHAPSGTPVMVDGKKSRTLGRVSMDMLYVDLTDIPSADMHSDVELWGTNILVDEVAKEAKTVGYELLCAISSSIRVPMEYA